MLSHLSYLFQFCIVWILRLINFTTELTDYMMLLYLQGVTLNMLFVQSLILKLNHVRHFIKIPFLNKGMDLIDLPSIFRDKSVQSSIPNYFKNCEVPIICNKYNKSRKENPQKLTQLSSRSHPRHLVGKRIAQKDTIIDIISDSQVNSNFLYT